MEYTLQEAYDQLLEPFTDKDSWDHMEKCEIKSAIRVFRHYIETLVGVVSRPELGGGGGLAHALKKLNEQATKDERQWTDDQDDEEWITPFKGTLPEWRQGRGKMIRSAPRLSLLKTLDGDIKANLMTGEVLRMVKAEIAIALVLLE